MIRVLVVDDDFRERGFFQIAFPGAVTDLRSVAAVKAALAEGLRWDVAFIDFDLADAERSGLSAWIALRPVTRWCVSYTRAAESGRVLYNLATRHWFAADAVLDKSLADPDELARYVHELAQGLDPTPRNVRRKLDHAHRIDEILPDPQSVLLWRKWNDLGGDEPAIQRQLGVTPHVTRKFKETVEAPVASLLFDVFNVQPVEKEGKKSKFAGPLSNFAGRHRNFFNAGDLDRAVIAQPLAFEE